MAVHNIPTIAFPDMDIYQDLSKQTETNMSFSLFSGLRGCFLTLHEINDIITSAASNVVSFP